MAKEKNNEKVSFLGFDPVETADEIIDSDKDVERKEAFKEAYKRVMRIIPEYFLTGKRRKGSASGGGNAFTQNIIVTPENVKLETKEQNIEEIDKENEKERS